MEGLGLMAVVGDTSGVGTSKARTRKCRAAASTVSLGDGTLAAIAALVGFYGVSKRSKWFTRLHVSEAPDAMFTFGVGSGDPLADLLFAFTFGAYLGGAKKCVVSRWLADMQSPVPGRVHLAGQQQP